MKLKKLFAGILAATMVMATALPALADPNDQILNNTQNKTTPPDVAITKAVVAPAGEDVSAIGQRSYTFNFKQIAGEYDADGDAGDQMIKSWAPDDTAAGYEVHKVDIASVSATVNPDTAQTVSQKADAGRNVQTGTAVAQKRTEGGNDYYMMETPNFLSFMTKDTFKPGVYAYEVTETVPNPNPETSRQDINATTWFENEYKYSTAKYRMLLYTEWVDKADETKGTYIWAMTVVKVEEDGQEIQNDPKDDPTAGGDSNKEGDLSHFQFDNVFKRTKKSTNPNEYSYRVQKRVEGVQNLAFRDALMFGDTAQKFKFTVKIINNPLYAVPAAGYTAEVFTIDPANPATANQTNPATTYTFNEGSWTQVVELAHNQYLAFDGLPDGTKFEVIEENYTKEAVAGIPSKMSDLMTAKPDWYATNDENKIEAYVTTFEGADTDTNNGLKGSGQIGDAAGQYRSTLYKNNANKGTTPAGIIMQYLPFVVIIALAIVALIAYVMIKGRRRVAR